ncbi:MAG: hypothetical protein K4305_05045 [Chlorobium sp.]|uniref:hypothetical protein n=1 Tax=Chlorobium sp. TaxID=1095 RepID=UPI002F3EC5BC
MTRTWERIIRDNRETILKRWHECGLDLFSGKMVPGTPLAEALADAMGMILDGFHDQGELCREGVMRLTRILAVHPFPPSKSLSLFRELRSILQDIGGIEGDGTFCAARIEEIVFESFDRFMEHRETIYQLKVEESRSKMHMQLRRTGS